MGRPGESLGEKVTLTDVFNAAASVKDSLIGLEETLTDHFFDGGALNTHIITPQKVGVEGLHAVLCTETRRGSFYRHDLQKEITADEPFEAESFSISPILFNEVLVNFDGRRTPQRWQGNIFRETFWRLTLGLGELENVSVVEIRGDKKVDAWNLE